MSCLLCSGIEANYTEREYYGYICSTCIQYRLLPASQKTIKEAYLLCMEKGQDRKAEALWSFMNPKTRQEAEEPDGEANEFRPGMAGEGVVPEVKSPYERKVRQKCRVRKLDKGRAQAR